MTVLGSPSSPTHPLVRLVDELEALLDDHAQGNAWSLTPNELQTLLPRLTRAKARLNEVELRVLREADRHSVGSDVGATNTPAWWAHATGQRVPTARAAAHLAKALDDHEATAAALSAGTVNLDQAHAILTAIHELPTDLGPDLAADAEHHLLSLADLDGETRLDPKALRVAGRKILDVLAPEIAEDHERRLLEAEEWNAEATAYLRMRPDGHGSMLGTFKIPLLHGEILTKHLAALAAPRHQRATRTSDNQQTEDQQVTVSRPLRLGHAFCEYLETRHRHGTPKAGGIAATVVVTITLEQLLGNLRGSEHGALLDTGETITAATARRLACEAGLIPAVLGTRSQPLDLGRKTRFHTETQRTALILRDHGCAAAGCDWPPGMCHAHHLTPWSRGGKTTVNDAVLLCPRHHTLAHDARYRHTTDATTGKTTGPRITFTRRT